MTQKYHSNHTAAEDALRKAENESHLQTRLARALYAGAIEWCKPRGFYRFGIFDQDSPAGPKIVQVFHPDTGQEPSLHVLTLDALTQLEQDSFRTHSTGSQEWHDIYSGTQEVHKRIRKAQKRTG